jgi:hypothetical protein
MAIKMVVGNSYKLGAYIQPTQIDIVNGIKLILPYDPNVEIPLYNRSPYGGTFIKKVNNSHEQVSIDDVMTELLTGTPAKQKIPTDLNTVMSMELEQRNQIFDNLELGLRKQVFIETMKQIGAKCE